MVSLWGKHNVAYVLYIYNHFNSPSLIEKLFERNVYDIGTVRKDRKFMLPLMKVDKEMQRGWMDNKSVIMLSTAVDGFNTLAAVQRRQKESATAKSTFNCPTVVKLYNSGMGGMGLLDQRAAACRLYRKSRCRFYLHIFFDLWDIARTNAFIVFNILLGTVCWEKVCVIGKYSKRVRGLNTSHCNVALCLVKEINCFLFHHSKSYWTRRISN